MLLNWYKNVVWFCITAVLIFAVLARGAVRTWSLAPVLIVLILLIAAWLLRAINTRGYQMERTALDVPLGAFFLLACISAVRSVYLHDSIVALIELAVYIGIYYLVVNEFDHHLRRRMLNVVVGFGALLSLYGLLQYVAVLPHDWWAPQNCLAATYVNHNHFAGYLELALPVAVGMLLKTNTARQPVVVRLTYIVALVLMIAALVLTQSRSAWIALTISLVVMGALVLRGIAGNKKNIIILALLTGATIFFIWTARDVVARRIELATPGETIDASLTVRALIWQGAGRMIAAQPLVGTGIGTFIWAFPQYRPADLTVQANFAHNDYLQTAAEMGVPALLVMIWMLVVIIRTGMRCATADPRIFSCAIGVLSLTLHGLSDFNFHIPANMLLFTIYCGFIMRGETQR